MTLVARSTAQRAAVAAGTLHHSTNSLLQTASCGRTTSVWYQRLISTARMPSLFAEMKAGRQLCIYKNVAIVLGSKDSKYVCMCQRSRDLPGHVTDYMRKPK